MNTDSESGMGEFELSAGLFGSGIFSSSAKFRSALVDEGQSSTSGETETGLSTSGGPILNGVRNKPQGDTSRVLR